MRLFIAFLTSLVGCQQDPFVTLSVTGIPQNASTLRVLAHLDGRAGIELPAYQLDGFTGRRELTLGVRVTFPKDLLMSRLILGVGAFTAEGCLIAVGSQQQNLTVAGDSARLSLADVTLIPVPAACSTMDRALLKVEPALLSTQGLRLLGSRDPIHVYGWNVDPRASLFIGGLPAQSVRWNSPVELIAAAPSLPGAFGPVEVSLANDDKSTVSRTDLLSYFAAKLDFENFKVFRGALGGDTTDKLTALMIGDYNNDLQLDLIVQEVGFPQRVDVLLGMSEGGFRVPLTSYLTPNDQLRMEAIADIDRDGTIDLLLLSPDGISVALGNGDGTFQFAKLVASAKMPLSLSVADFDGDSALDLAVSSMGIDGVDILYNNGHGVFPALSSQHLLTGGTPERITAADLSPDGRLDLVMVQGGALVIWLQGKGNSFTLAQKVAGPFSGALTVGDFDKDHLVDIVAATGDKISLKNTLSWLRNTGDGTVTVQGRVEPGQDPTWYSIDAIDLDRDGWLDVLAGDGHGAACVMYNRSGSGFLPQACFGVPTPYADGLSRIAVGDLDKDYYADFVAPRGPDVFFMQGNRRGGFHAPQLFLFRTLTVGDYNRDGWPDLITGSAGGPPYTLSMWLGTSSGRLEQGATFDLNNDQPISATLANFNHDEQTELAILTQSSGQTRYLILAQDDRGRIKILSSNSLVPDARVISSGDIDGDGIQDIITTNLSNASVALGNGDGTFKARFELLDTRSKSFDLLLQDFNTDGKLDLATIGGSEDAPAVLILLGHGDGEFSQSTVNIGNVKVSSIASGDVDGDGKQDLVVGSATSLQLLLGSGAGTFTKVGDRAGSFAKMAVADLDGDHRGEIIANQTGGMSILKYQPDGKLEQVFQSAICTNAPAVVGDFNADHRPDLLLATCENTTNIMMNTSW